MKASDKINDKDIFNISSHLHQMAAAQPYKRAVVYPVGRDKNGRVAYSHLTFRQLDQESDCLAYGLEKAGISHGTRTVLMVKPSPEFFALTFALFKAGAVPVVVDPGMGVRRMIACFQETRPRAFIGIPLAHVLRKIYPQFFDTVTTWITVGRRWFWGGFDLNQIRRMPWKPYSIAATKRDEIAAILFTTGSTGPAKGTVYTHGIFDAQIRHIRSHFAITADEIDLPTFPLFALFDPALGMTAVIPDMDPTKPGAVNPKRIIEAIANQGVTNMFASPALLHRVGGYGKQQRIKLPTLKRVISAGAPVSPANIEQFASMLRPDTEVHTPYGATEAMPVSSISSREILSETRQLSEQGYGMCVGRPLGGIEVRIIKISDDPIQKWSQDLVVADGEIGEITVTGDLVTRQYFEKPRADKLAKIKAGHQVWHRMGDLGRQDSKGRIWFCGRKSHRVTTANSLLFTIPCEAIFNNHPRVFRSALVGIGPPSRQKPVICIELARDAKRSDKDQIRKELLELAQENKLTKEIKTVLFHKAFPVDIRHNSKIFREKLAVWAAKKIKP
ncbi:fatty acid CoA ligase family protein [Thermodesulfobacteriota bacterium]